MFRTFFTFFALLQERAVISSEVVCDWPVLEVWEDDSRTSPRALSMEHGYNWCSRSWGKCHLYPVHNIGRFCWFVWMQKGDSVCKKSSKSDQERLFDVQVRPFGAIAVLFSSKSSSAVGLWTIGHDHSFFSVVSWCYFHICFGCRLKLNFFQPLWCSSPDLASHLMMLGLRSQTERYFTLFIQCTQKLLFVVVLVKSGAFYLDSLGLNAWRLIPQICI